MDDCIFCKIAKGDIPSAKVYEDEKVYAFLDLSQVTKGHTLIIPKTHARNIFDLPEDEAAEVFRRVPKIANALKETLALEGLNVLNNNEEVASQSVFHTHIHLLPRYSAKDDFGLKWKDNSGSYTQESFQELAESIAAHIQ
ncbi:HIT family protein [Listeria costaricensis]|uniref:HIT family protein n=1 Tax=Listeria costaricensis TaxID=2026604 RepID=UPI000C06E0DC|nr:HIT family protein [Listeria costaricensis]